MLDALPSCFSNHGSQAPETASSSSSSSSSSTATTTKSAQNLVTCLYKTKLAGQPCLMYIAWSKSLMKQGFTVSFDHPACKHICSVDLKPWVFWKKKGSKGFEMGEKKVEVFWDLSLARYACGPEPHEAFYVAVVCGDEVILLLGDMHKEAHKKLHAHSPPSADATLLSRKEHVYGKQLYTTKAQLSESGRPHDIAIECHLGDDDDPPSHLSVLVDKQIVVHVTGLMWKFRGNQTIQIDGLPIEVFWDVHNWLFNPDDGHAVFMFHTCMEHEKPWLRGVGIPSSAAYQAPDTSWGCVLQWPTTSNSFKEKEPFYHGSAGFLLLLYAWKHE